jgi:hypothetical protein
VEEEVDLLEGVTSSGDEGLLVEEMGGSSEGERFLQVRKGG